MSTQLASIFFAAYFILEAAVLSPSLAAAKGGNYIKGARVEGGHLQAARDFQISLPEEYDDMGEIDVPAYQQRTPETDRLCAGSPACQAARAPAPHEPAADELPYRIVLHYDFAEFGGKRDWVGQFDGKDTLYFPEPMIVGPGLWAAGWYRAAPLLASSLRAGIGLPPLVSPPASGDGGLIAPPATHSSPAPIGIPIGGLVLVGLALLQRHRREVRHSP